MEWIFEPKRRKRLLAEIYGLKRPARPSSMGNNPLVGWRRYMIVCKNKKSANTCNERGNNVVGLVLCEQSRKPPTEDPDPVKKREREELTSPHLGELPATLSHAQRR
ncbi:hypothetical protein SLA2020_510090 [Shorea laevis]